MALLRKFFSRKPPDGLLVISERVYVFDCCFTTEAWNEENYKVYIGGIVGQLQDHLPEALFLVFNFREGEAQSEIANILTEYDMTVMDYPRHFEGCPVLTIEVIHHFLKSSESWLALGQHNVLVMHCERGGWLVLAFMLAALLIYRKQYSGEQKTLDMVYKQAPLEILHFLSPLNPMPSQLRYLQYVSRRNVAIEWPPLDRALTLDCIILRFIPDFDGHGGCRPIFRVYGQDPFLVADKTPKVLYSTPKRRKTVRAYKQGECELVKIDINCHIQGDVVVECVSLNDEMAREEMMFRVMFNTAFIRSNILILNRDEIDILWNARDQFPKDFRAEILFFEEGLPMEAFAKVQEFFSYVDCLDPKADASLNVLQHMSASNIVHELLESSSHESVETSGLLQETSPRKLWEKKKPTVLESKAKSSLSLSPEIQSMSMSSPKQSPGTYLSRKVAETPDIQILLQLPRQSDISCQGMPQSSQSTIVSSKSVEDSSVAQTSDIEHQLHYHTLSESAETTHPPAISPVIIDPTLSVSHTSESLDAKIVSVSPPTPPPPPPQPSSTDVSTKLFHSPTPPPPPTLMPPRTPPLKEKLAVRAMLPLLPPPPPHTMQTASPTILATGLLLNPPSAPAVTSSTRLPPNPPPPPILPPPPTPPLKEKIAVRARHPPPPPPPLPPPPPPHSQQVAGPRVPSLVPPPPPAPIFSYKNSHPASQNSPPIPSPPPPPAPFLKGTSRTGDGHPGSLALDGNGSPSSGSPSNSLSRGKGQILSRTISAKNYHNKKLKPLHWLKLTRAASGTLWAEAQKLGAASKAPDIDISELENLFSASLPSSDHVRKSMRGSVGPKSDKVQLIDHRRAYNCEIMLSMVKVSLHDLVSSVLALEDSALDVDQVENLIKFCPTKEEMELLKGYTGEKEKLGKCEQFFLELMQVPRVECKLAVFSFKIQFHSQVSDLRKGLNVANSAAEEIKNSAKLKRIMQTVLSLGNALNQGTARGSAIGFRLDSLLKLTDTRARNHKMTLMHYLCKVLSDKLPEVLDFSIDLASLELASKIQLKYLAEEMQAISKGLEKVIQELSASENDGPVSENFHKTLKEFLLFSEAEVRSLASLYSGMGRNVDALIIYFGEDPSRCPFEQVISTLLSFVRMFKKAHEENCRQLELEKKKRAESEKTKTGASHEESK
ncbi:LOW QUALITY PROTEIN: formin-like protein 13 [Juglans microcarpa x Juglans regia]|uniref:LOW QUALITY PROTEIN: formin-like protein 13 n=1 Tax=Juglans microcarpa x Juglans regia TaxID=2249226 RepID=UPI001B7EF4FB|nr:LOW QUALITY PROTEIN: formin-like protein 13 [Juglans microcarpa x Juglans regia]